MKYYFFTNYNNFLIIYFLLAKAYHEVGNYNEALRHFGRQHELRKEKYGTEFYQDVAQAQFDIARQKYFLGKYQDALADFEKNLGNFLILCFNFIIALGLIFI